MEWVETTGKTVEEAKDVALDQLGVDELDADFEIVEEPRTGLFKRIRGEARVRARVKPRQPRPKQERKGGRRGSGTPRSGGAKTGDRQSAPDDGPTKGPAGPKAKRGPGRSQEKAEPGKPMGNESPIDAPGDPRGGSTMNEPVTVERQAEIMEGFLVGLFEVFGVQGEVQRHRVDDDTIELDVVGNDLGLLIGPKGSTLQAVQDLARTVVQRRELGEHEGRVRIDISGYRQKRREALGRFAVAVADEVVGAKVAKALEPMGAADRKAVHDAVNDIEGVVSSSEGQEPRRWVVISPTGD